MGEERNIVIVHGGRAWPNPATTRAIIREALVEGLDRVDSHAAGLIRRGDVRVTIVYYADLMNRVLARSDRTLRAEFLSEGTGRFLPSDEFDEAMHRLTRRSAAMHTLAEHRALRARVARDRPIPRNPTGAQWRKHAPDLWSYLHDECTGIEVRTRVMLPLVRGLTEAPHVLVLSHGMGCAVTYDALWIISRTPEFRSAHKLRVSRWITMGSPLTRRFVNSRLLDAHAPAHMKFPANVRDWLDVRALGDRVPGRMLASGYFAPMLQRDLVQAIEDARPDDPIPTFWLTRRGLDPHAMPGYLNHPWISRRIARWIHDPRRPAKPPVVVTVRRPRINRPQD